MCIDPSGLGHYRGSQPTASAAPAPFPPIPLPPTEYRLLVATWVSGTEGDHHNVVVVDYPTQTQADAAYDSLIAQQASSGDKLSVRVRKLY